MARLGKGECYSVGGGEWERVLEEEIRQEQRTAFEPFRSGDKRLVFIALALVIGGLSFTYLNYNAAFPQASLDLQLSKGEITARARAFLLERGLSVEGYRQLTLFSPDDDARLFLEHELGLAEANRLMEGEVSVWRWRARWFRPPEKEEMTVFLSPAGRLVAFEHVIPETREGERLNRDEALTLARTFLEQQTTDPHTLVEEQLRERPNRLDYVFTWERDGFRAKDATYRRTVVVKGDSIGQFSEYLHVPERWEREYSALRSSNRLYTSIAQALYALLALAALVVLFQALRRGEIRWRPLIGISAAAALLAVLNEWNFLPFYIDGMPTSTKYRDMILLSLLQGLGGGVGYFFYIIFGAAPGEPLYRKWMPERLSLGNAFTPQGIRTREFFRATLAGYGLTGAHMAFLVAFYLISQRLGAWNPQDVEYSNVLSTAAPWLYPMTIGVLASTSEEFWFRLLAIPLLKRLTGSTWIAVIVPAFVWGFLHANYPQQPGFIRGIEVGLIGVAAGYLLLRFGILATLIWHYTVNALLVSSVLFESSVWYDWAAGIVVSAAVLIPLGVSLVHYRRNGGFLADPALSNRAQTAIAQRETQPASPEPPGQPLAAAWPARILYLSAAVAVVAGIFLRSPEFGGFIKVRVSKSQAESTAGTVLAERGDETDGWRSATRFIPNLSVEEFEFLRRIRGAGEANRIVAGRTFHAVWQVRYFRAQQPEEWRIFVDQDGRAYRSDHVLDEIAPGAELSSAEALAVAQEHLARDQGIPLDGYRLVDSSANKRENRTDHDFVWEDIAFDVGGAKARLSLSLVGEEPSYFRRFLKLPEDWLREFRRPRLRQYIAPALGGALAFPLLVLFILRVSGRGKGPPQRYRWKLYLGLAGVSTLLTAAGIANRWGDAFSGYDTAEPLGNFISQWLISAGIQVALAFLGIFILAMATDVFLQLAVGRRTLPRPSLPRTLAVAGLLWGVMRAASGLQSLIPGDRFDLPLWNLPGIGSDLPGLAAVSHGFFSALLTAGLALIAGAAAYRYLFNRAGVVLFAGLASLFAFAGASNFLQWLFTMAEASVLLGLIVFLIRTCGLDLAGFAVALFWITGGAAGIRLLSQPAADLRWNGAAVVALIAVAGLGALMWSRTALPHPAAEETDSPASSDSSGSSSL